jgi:hypothetical protein
MINKYPDTDSINSKDIEKLNIGRDIRAYVESVSSETENVFTKNDIENALKKAFKPDKKTSDEEK